MDVPPTTPLFEVTFVVLDLETTGTGPRCDAITEVGAVKYRGGELMGTFQTLVDPGVAMPPSIVYLTGITESMVAAAPTIDSVLPAFTEFLGDAVVVGHNVRFDLSFLRAAWQRLGYDVPTNVSVDTLAMARRLLARDVMDCRLQTVARYLRTAVRPTHRALDDARATADVFHRFLEDVGTLGVTALDDLLALPATARHPQFGKLRWAAALPRTPGVFLLRDHAGDVVHVGAGADLRAVVRGLFTSTDRRHAAPALAAAVALDHVTCATELEARVRELRLVHRHRPRTDPRTRALRRRRDLIVAAARDGSLRVRVCAMDRLHGEGEERFGPFPDAATARAAVATLPDLPREVLERRRRVDHLLGRGRIDVTVDGVETTIEDGVLDLGDGAGAPLPGTEGAADEADLIAAWWEAHPERVSERHASSTATGRAAGA